MRFNLTAVIWGRGHWSSFICASWCHW